VDWILSAISMVMMYMMGNKNRFAPVVGIACQILWIYYAISLKQYGLLIGTIGYLVIHIINTFKWNKEHISKLLCLNPCEKDAHNYKCVNSKLYIVGDGLWGDQWENKYKCNKCGHTYYKVEGE